MGGRRADAKRKDAGRGDAKPLDANSLSVGGPELERQKAKSDVMQTALQVEAYERSPDELNVLMMADDADTPDVAEADAGAAAAEEKAKLEDEHDYDDVVEQTFPASDAPPLP